MAAGSGLDVATALVRGSAILVATPSRCGLTHRAMANLSDHAILRLFCPTDQRLCEGPKSLIPLMPATVHGVVFEVFVLEARQCEDEPDLIRLARYFITRKPLVVNRCVLSPGRTGRLVPAALPVPGG
jgi:hypothetical protein